jgi:hypothetical protein
MPAQRFISHRRGPQYIARQVLLREVHRRVFHPLPSTFRYDAALLPPKRGYHFARLYIQACNHLPPPLQCYHFTARLPSRNSFSLPSLLLSYYPSLSLLSHLFSFRPLAVLSLTVSLNTESTSTPGMNRCALLYIAEEKTLP